MDSDPLDVGFTISSVLNGARTSLAKKKPWYESSVNVYKKSPKGAANGSLMRNAPIAVLAINQSLQTAITHTVLQGIITHFGPLPVLSCVIQTVLLYKALTSSVKNPPTFSDIESIISNEWKEWKENTKKSKKSDSYFW